MTKNYPYLGEILMRKQIITCQQLDDALKEQRLSGKFLGAILFEKRSINEQQLLEALSEQFSMPFTSIKDKYIDWNLVHKFSSSLIIEHRCFPIEADEDFITFAINNPLDMWLLEEAEHQAAPLKIKTVLVSSQDMEECLSRYRKYLQSKMDGMFKEGGNA
jgi:MSHA biogenesis protein MshE